MPLPLLQLSLDPVPLSPIQEGVELSSPGGMEKPTHFLGNYDLDKIVRRTSEWGFVSTSCPTLISQNHVRTNTTIVSTAITSDPSLGLFVSFLNTESYFYEGEMEYSRATSLGVSYPIRDQRIDRTLIVLTDQLLLDTENPNLSILCSPGVRDITVVREAYGIQVSGTLDVVNHCIVCLFTLQGELVQGWKSTSPALTHSTRLAADAGVYRLIVFAWDGSGAQVI